MIGSHNSATYLPEKKWWMKALRPWTKCQNKSLKQQYDEGIRYFDFRVKIDDTNIGYTPWVCHNNVIYKKRFYQALKEIDYQDVNIRVLLDYREKPKNAERLSRIFEEMIKFIYKNYKLKLDNAITFWNWKEYVPSSFVLQEKHYSVDSKHWYDWVLGPYLFNKLKEKNYSEHFNEIKDKESEHIVILKDFV